MNICKNTKEIKLRLKAPKIDRKNDREEETEEKKCLSHTYIVEGM